MLTILGPILTLLTIVIFYKGWDGIKLGLLLAKVLRAVVLG